MFASLQKYKKTIATLFLSAFTVSLVAGILPFYAQAQIDDSNRFIYKARVEALQALNSGNEGEAQAIIRNNVRDLDEINKIIADSLDRRKVLQAQIEANPENQAAKDELQKETTFWGLAVAGRASRFPNELREQTENEKRGENPINCKGGFFSNFFFSESDQTLFCAALAAGEWLLWIASFGLDAVLIFVDKAVEVSITDFSDLVSGGVRSAWQVSRNVANIFFIFLLLYAAAGYMLNLRSIGGGRGYLVNIILVAIFINFSFLLTSFVIDITNVAASTIYTTMTKDVPVDTRIGKKSLSNLLVKQLSAFDALSTVAPLSATVADRIEKTSTSQAQTAQLREKQIQAIKGFDLWDAVLSTAGGIAVILAATLAFGIGAVLLLLRAIILIFSLALAPLAFLTVLFPKFDYFNEWWSTLVHHAVFGPAYLLMMYIAIFIVSGTNGQGGILALASNTQGVVGHYTLIMVYILVIGIFLLGVYVANRLGVSGAAWASQTVNTAKGYAAAGAFGTAKFGIRPLTYGAGRIRDGFAQGVEKAQKKSGFLGGIARTAFIRDLPGAYRKRIDEEQTQISGLSSDALKQLHNRPTTDANRQKAIIKELAKRDDLSPAKGSGGLTAEQIQEGVESLKTAGIVRDEKAGELDKLTYQYATTSGQWQEAFKNIPTNKITEIETQRFRDAFENPNPVDGKAIRDSAYGNLTGGHITKLLDNKETSDIFFENLVKDYRKEKHGGNQTVQVSTEDITKWVGDDVAAGGKGNRGLAASLAGPAVVERLGRENNVISNKKIEEDKVKKEKKARDEEQARLNRKRAKREKERAGREQDRAQREQEKHEDEMRRRNEKDERDRQDRERTGRPPIIDPSTGRPFGR